MPEDPQQAFATDGDVTNEEFIAGWIRFVTWLPVIMGWLYFEAAVLDNAIAIFLFPHLMPVAAIAWVYTFKREVVASMLAFVLAVRDGALAFLHHRRDLLEGGA